MSTAHVPSFFRSAGGRVVPAFVDVKLRTCYGVKCPALQPTGGYRSQATVGENPKQHGGGSVMIWSWFVAVEPCHN